MIDSVKGAAPCVFVPSPTDRADSMACLLEELGATAVELRDDTTMTPGGGGALLIAGFESAAARDFALARLAREAPGAEATAVDVTDDGWSAGWRAYFRPVVLDRLQVITPWMPPPRDDRITIVIDPGLAFGTGGHATTRLVLELLERMAAGGNLPQSVLDVGTGSGVLAIAAIKLGAKRAFGIDIDEESVAAVAANARANGVEAFVTADLTAVSSLEGTWPLVLANIELSVFERHAQDIAKRVAPGGRALLSGLLEDQVARCVALWPGFEVVRTAVDAGWAAIALRRLG